MATEQASSEVKIERLTRTLRVELTPPEVAKRADRLALVVAEREGKVEEAKTAAAHIKARIKELEAELRSLSNEVRGRAKYSEVECERRYNYRLGTVTVVRLDTSAAVDERAMSGAERQLGNGLKEPKDVIGPELPTAKKRGGARKKKADQASAGVQ